MKKEVVEQAKKVLAKKKAKKEVCNSETEVARLENLIEHLLQIVCDINKRIDNIITAHDKCKSLKGL